MFYTKHYLYHYITVLGHPSNLELWPIQSSYQKYHYITVLGHPSNDEYSVNQYKQYRTITLQFWGILPTKPSKFYRTSTNTYHYITVLGHPSNLEKIEDIGPIVAVPLHYSSGASFQPSQRTSFVKQQIVPLHYSSGASFQLV